MLRRLVVRERPSLNDLLSRPEAAGSAHWIVVGTVDDAFDEIIERIGAEAADGFIALPGGALQSLDLLLDELVPRLVEVGRFRRGYTAETFAENMGIA